MKKLLIMILLCAPFLSVAQEQEYKERFEQLGTMLPTPNSYRTASGATGRKLLATKSGLFY